MKKKVVSVILIIGLLFTVLANASVPVKNVGKNDNKMFTVSKRLSVGQMDLLYGGDELAGFLCSIGFGVYGLITEGAFNAAMIGIATTIGITFAVATIAAGAVICTFFP